MTEQPFRLSPDEMRSMGYRVIDQLVHQLEQVDDGPVVIPATAGEMRARIAVDPPSSPVAFGDLMAMVAGDVVPHSTLWGHPRNFAYVPGSGTWIGALADLIASTLNLEASVWRESPGPVHLELMVLEWFRQWVGFPEGASGLLVGGGSAANLTALAAARQAVVGTGHPEATVYCASEVHSSITRAARVLGFGDDQIRAVSVDRLGAMVAGDLAARVEADLAAGARPVIVVVSAGTTSTGAVDPIADIARIARRHGMWLHVDAAYGGFAVLTDRGKDRLGPLGLADSITLDPHKWLFQPYEVGALLVRRPEFLEEAFRMRPAYLQDTTDRHEEVNLADRGLQQTRAFRALKVWMSILGYGRRLPGGHRHLSRPGPPCRAAGGRLRPFRVVDPGPALDRLFPAVRPDRGGNRSPQRRPGREAARLGRGVPLLDPGGRPVCAAHVSGQPRHYGRRRRPGSRLARDGLADRVIRRGDRTCRRRCSRHLRWYP